MSTDNTNVKNKPGTKEGNTTYIFFCEGKTEADFIEEIDQARILDGITIQCARLPKLEDDGGSYFTPQRILDYYLDMVTNNEGWIYSYPRPSGDYHQEGCCKCVKDENTKICLLIDTDVFFKSNRVYDNLEGKPNANNILNNNYLDATLNDRRVNLQDRIDFLHTYDIAPVPTQEYKFLEQELNFEDFFVLFFMNDDIYNRWFTKRFGRLPNIPRPVDRSCYFGGDLDNSKSGKTEIKPAFHNVTGVGEDIFVWLKFHVTDKKSWIEYIERAKERMGGNKNYERNGYRGFSGWPFRFGLVDFLIEHINKGD